MVDVENEKTGAADMEEGELSDEADDEHLKVKEEMNTQLVNYEESDREESELDEGEVSEEEDEPPQEISNKSAREVSEVKVNTVPGEENPSKDPTLCYMCQKQTHRYRCPKCNLRTCSVVCSKEHKEKYNCDGVRAPFQRVQKLSQFSADKSIEDQHFLQKVSESVHGTAEEPPTKKIKSENLQEIPADNSSKQQPVRLIEGVRYVPNSGRERYLMEGALQRHLFFAFNAEETSGQSKTKEEGRLMDRGKGHDDEDEESGSKFIDMDSHINFFSQNIFWTLSIVFRRPGPGGDGTYLDYTHTVHKIPDSICVATVLRQFLKPRPYGCIISASELDLVALKPFIELGIDNLNVFMPVPRDEQKRYYLISPQKTILDNLRKRFIVEHPVFVITFQDECIEMEVISDEGSTEVNSRVVQDRKAAMSGSQQSGLPFNRNRGGHRGGGFQQRGRGGGEHNKRGGGGARPFRGHGGRGRGLGNGGPSRGRGGDFSRRRPWN